MLTAAYLTLPRFRTASMLACAAGVCLSLSTRALADEPPLGGPKVEERNVPGVRNTFGEGGPGQRRMGDAIPPQALRRALMSVIGPEAPEATRATPEQWEKIEGIVAEHEQATRAYMQEHREELAKLRQEAGGPRNGPDGERPRRRPDGQGRPPMDDMMGTPGADGDKSDEARQAARDRMREIMLGAPKPEGAMTKVWAELSAEQRTAVDARLDEVRERMSRERQDRYVEERMRQRDGDGRGPEAGPRGRPGPEGRRAGGPGVEGGPGGRISPERRERLLRLFEQMTPEQQDQMLQRLEQRAREGGAPPEARARGRQGDEGRRPGGPGPEGARRGRPAPDPK